MVAVYNDSISVCSAADFVEEDLRPRGETCRAETLNVIAACIREKRHMADADLKFFAQEGRGNDTGNPLDLDAHRYH
jgi:hypothetical protein